MKGEHHEIPDRAAFLLLVVSLSLAGAGPRSSEEPGRSPSEYFQAWSEALRNVDLLGDPREVFQPNTYYVDDFGAFYFDADYNRIYTAAASPNDTASRSRRAFKAGCWQFTFSQSGSFFPNPSGGTQVVKANVNLLVLGTDYQFYPATITSRVVNVASQLVKDTTVGTFYPNPNFTITVWDGTNSSGQIVASGNYYITVTATSSLCGSKSFNGTATRIN